MLESNIIMSSIFIIFNNHFSPEVAFIARIISKTYFPPPFRDETRNGGEVIILVFPAWQTTCDNSHGRVKEDLSPTISPTNVYSKSITNPFNILINLGRNIMMIFLELLKYVCLHLNSRKCALLKRKRKSRRKS